MRGKGMGKGTVRKILYTVILCVVVLLAGMGCGSGEDNLQSEDDKTRGDAAQEGIVEDIRKAGNIGEEDEWKDVGGEDEMFGNQEVDEAGFPEEDLNKEKAEGKKLSIFGDSISTFYGWIPERYNYYYPSGEDIKTIDQIWWKMLLDDMGMEFCANGSSAGSTCAGDSLSLDNPQYGCDDYRIGGLVGEGGIYPDIIIVYMGTNDLITSIPIGENDGTQLVDEGIVDNFSDAYCLMLDKLQAQYPGAEIFCCNLPPIGDWGSEGRPFDEFVNHYELTSEDYSRQIEIIAAAKGFPIIDLWHCGITMDNMGQYTLDSGVHPNSEGMKMIRDAAKAAITSFYQ